MIGKLLGLETIYKIGKFGLEMQLNDENITEAEKEKLLNQLEDWNSKKDIMCSPVYTLAKKLVVSAIDTIPTEKIKDIMKNIGMPLTIEALQNDENILKLSEYIYDLLIPKPFTLTKPLFQRVLLSTRDLLINKLLENEE